MKRSDFVEDIDYEEALEKENAELEQQIKRLEGGNIELQRYFETATYKFIDAQQQINELKEELIAWNELAISRQPFVVDRVNCKLRIQALKDK